MSSPSDCFEHSPALRVRPVPELDCCLVFTPRKPRLFTLNPAAWLVLELCDGRGLADISAAYRAATEADPNDAEVETELRAILDHMERNGIVVRREAEDPTQRPHRRSDD